MVRPTSKKVVIVICLASAVQEIRQQIKINQACRWFENHEVEDITLRLFNNTLSGILALSCNRVVNTYNDSRQGNIDYLEYRGFSIEDSFFITNLCDNLVLGILFDICPMLDDNDHVRIIDYSFKNNRDFLLHLELFHAEQPQTISNYPNYPYPRGV